MFLTVVTAVKSLLLFVTIAINIINNIVH